jgi:hypothetical protein
MVVVGKIWDDTSARCVAVIRPFCSSQWRTHPVTGSTSQTKPAAALALAQPNDLIASPLAGSPYCTILTAHMQAVSCLL